MKTTSFCLRDSQDQYLDDIVRQSIAAPDVPELSKSEVIRRLLDSGLENDPELKDLLTESTIVKYREERFMADEGDLRNKRTGFETQVKRHFKRRFENGFRPAQLEEWAENMRQKAEAYWPRDVGEDYSERRKEALRYVDAMVNDAKKASETSEYDPLDPEQVFSRYGGVEKGREVEEAHEQLDDLVDDALDLITDSLGGTMIDAERVEPEEAKDILSNRTGVPERLAGEAVDRAVGRLGSGVNL